MPILFALACGGGNANVQRNSATTTPTAIPTLQPTPTDGLYPGTGKVTKIDNKLGSVGLDHDEIKGLMPPMVMEFYVEPKTLLASLKVGDRVTFTVEYKGGTEKVVAIAPAK